MPCKIHILQHAGFEGPGFIAKWIEQNNHIVNTTHLYLNEKLPNLNDLDFLIVMGGPMSVNDIDTIDWLEYELNFIKSAVEKGKVVLGICLGAQLIAKALNSDIYKGKHTEIGWFPVLFKNKDLPAELKTAFPDFINTFHWHSETFELPKGAVSFASSFVTPVQAFIYNKNVIGLQFHLEATAYSIEDFIENMGNEIQESRYIQTVEVIRKGALYLTENNKLINKILTYLSGRIN